MLKITPHLAWRLGLLMLACAGAAGAAPMSLDDRIACQRAVEQV